MDAAVREAIFRAVETEPFARALGMKLLALDTGYSLVEMPYNPEAMNNIYGRLHGGAMFSLMDEAFETVSQSEGTIAVALNVSITYVSSPDPGVTLVAEARQLNRTRKTALYDIQVRDREGKLVATSHALAFDTGKPIPFL